MEKDRLLEVAKVDKIPPLEKMKHVEVNGKEIVVSNIGSKFYPISDKCAHMNALLSTGDTCGDGIVTCP
jgi:nitrite reductase/ring-hydroxylating ferredoxin subunit